VAVLAAHEGESVRVEGLRIVRGGRELFDNLSFIASASDYIEIKGANGAGKTSLLRALAGFLWPAAGRIHVLGDEEPSTALHFIGHQTALKGAASVRSHLHYWAGLFGGEANADDVLAKLGIARAADLPVRALSQGQARRLSLARLLVAPRLVWLLDEPGAGLDSAGRAMLADLMTAHRAQGGTILAAVHEPLGIEPSLSLRVGA
jgi:heme exporter protein A